MAKFLKEYNCACCNLKLNLFKHLTDEEFEIINESRYEVFFNAGETIFKQGGPMTHIACITDGMAKIYLEGQRSRNVILKVVKPSELVGGPGFQVDNRHHFSVAAIKDTRACFIDIQAIEHVLKNSNQFSMAFIQHLNKIAIQMQRKLQALTQKQMRGRFADALLYLTDTIYENAEFETTLSRQDLADMSAMTKESAIRIMKEFKDSQIIDCEGNYFKILNQSELASISRTG